MNETAIWVASIIGLSFILAVAVMVTGKLQIERQRTLQKLLDHGQTGEALTQLAGLAASAVRDRRRGILLAMTGVAWSSVSYFIGGKAWLFGLVPILLGLAYLLLSKLDADRR